jgi:hypothetical protein
LPKSFHCPLLNSRKQFNKYEDVILATPKSVQKICKCGLPSPQPPPQPLPSLRFYCIGGFWDRTQDCCNDLSVLSTAQTWPRGLTETHFMLPSTVVQVRPMGLLADTFNSISYCNKVNNAKHTHCSLISSIASVTVLELTMQNTHTAR